MGDWPSAGARLGDGRGEAGHRGEALARARPAIRKRRRPGALVNRRRATPRFARTEATRLYMTAKPPTHAPACTRRTRAATLATPSAACRQATRRRREALAARRLGQGQALDEVSPATEERRLPGGGEAGRRWKGREEIWRGGREREEEIW